MAETRSFERSVLGSTGLEVTRLGLAASYGIPADAVERRGHRRVMHSREFRAAEKKFPQYELACRQLKHLSVR